MLPNERAIGQNKKHPRSVSYIDFLRLNIAWYISELEKLKNEIDDDGKIDNLKDSYRAMLLDKEYNGIKSIVRVIVPGKKPPNGWLSTTQRASNQNIFSDRLIVENFFGRLFTFNFIGSKWPRFEAKYCQFLLFSVALTNAHFLWNPLRADVSILYRLISSMVQFIGESLCRRRAANQNDCRERRLQRLPEQFDRWNNSSSSSIYFDQ